PRRPNPGGFRCRRVGTYTGWPLGQRQGAGHAVLICQAGEPPPTPRQRNRRRRTYDQASARPHRAVDFGSVWGGVPMFTDPWGERFGGLMLLFRGRTALTQRQLATRIGVSPRSIQTWETGVSYPAAASLQLLIAAFVDAHGFLPGHEATEAELLWEA